jgi:hypothetical protein
MDTLFAYFSNPLVNMGAALIQLLLIWYLVYKVMTLKQEVKDEALLRLNVLSRIDTALHEHTSDWGAGVAHLQEMMGVVATKDLGEGVSPAFVDAFNILADSLLEQMKQGPLFQLIDAEWELAAKEDEAYVGTVTPLDHTIRGGL